MEGKNLSIMIVDDIKENLDLLSNFFSKKYKVRTLPSGELALKSIANSKPDLILLDVNMPGMNGYEVCMKIKDNPDTEKIPVIFLSALSETFDKVKAFSAGGVDYITKPFQFEELESRVLTHLNIKILQEELRYQNKNLEKLVDDKVKEIRESQMATLIAIIKLAEARDDDTGKHIERLSIFSKLLAENLLKKNIYTNIINEKYIENLFYASPLHDIGKISIRDNILLKPGRHTPEEFEIMKTHAKLGAETLKIIKEKYPSNEFINLGIEIAKYHHEKWDGTGYPEGLKAEEIPLCARILALADVYDALRSKRIYKEAFSHEKSKSIILEGKGRHFDPEIVNSFFELEEEFNKIRNEMD